MVIIDELTEKNLILFAAQNYRKPNFSDIEEFYEDLKRFKYVKRLVNRYLEHDELAERLILNHIIILCNSFTISGALKIFELKLSKKHQEHLNQEDKDFEKLPEFKTISSKKSNFTKSNFNEKNNLDEWKRSHGNHSSNRFSNLSEVNLTNVENLDLVWKYKFNEIKRDIQANPVIAEGKIFLPTTSNKIGL